MQLGMSPAPDEDPAAALSAAFQSAGLGAVGSAAAPARSVDVDAAKRPDKFVLESRLIELGAALMVMQQSFKLLERDFYLAAFGRYDD